MTAEAPTDWTLSGSAESPAMARRRQQRPARTIRWQGPSSSDGRRHRVLPVVNSDELASSDPPSSPGHSPDGGWVADR